MRHMVAAAEEVAEVDEAVEAAAEVAAAAEVVSAEEAAVEAMEAEDLIKLLGQPKTSNNELRTYKFDYRRRTISPVTSILHQKIEEFKSAPDCPLNLELISLCQHLCSGFIFE